MKTKAPLSKKTRTTIDNNDKKLSKKRKKANNNIPVKHYHHHSPSIIINIIINQASSSSSLSSINQIITFHLPAKKHHRQESKSSLSLSNDKGHDKNITTPTEGIRQGGKKKKSKVTEEKKQKSFRGSEINSQGNKGNFLGECHTRQCIKIKHITITIIIITSSPSPTIKNIQISNANIITKKDDSNNIKHHHHHLH